MQKTIFLRYELQNVMAHSIQNVSISEGLWFYSLVPQQYLAVNKQGLSICGSLDMLRVWISLGSATTVIYDAIKTVSGDDGIETWMPQIKES